MGSQPAARLFSFGQPSEKLYSENERQNLTANSYSDWYSSCPTTPILKVCASAAM